MKKQFIMLVMAGMLLVPMGNVFAQGAPVGSSVGYMFPQTQSVVVIGEDASKGTVLSDAEISGYAYIPWVVVDAQNLNLPVGYNFSEFFEYGCEGFKKEDLSVKIMIAPTYQEEGSTEFVTGIFMDITSSPVINEEGAYAYKIIVTKPGSDSPLSKIESGYIGVSSLVGSSVEEAVPTAEKVTSSVESSAVAVESPSVSTAVAVPIVENDLPLYSPEYAVDVAEGVGSLSDFSDGGSSYSEDGVMTTDSLSASTVYGGPRYPNNPTYMSNFKIWRVQNQVKPGSIERCLDLINAERAKKGRVPVLLDQDLTKGALLRAAECTIYYDHVRPAGSTNNATKLPADGTEILVMGGSSPEAAVNAWMNSGNHYNVLMADHQRYIGIGQIGDSWVCFFRGDASNGNNDYYDQYYKPASHDFVKGYETTLREDDVVVDPTLFDVQLQKGYINPTLDMGKKVQLQPEILTLGTWTVSNYTKVAAYTVKWVSSNPSVASVNVDGVVTGLQTGNTVITGTINGKTLTYNLAVTGNGTPVTPPAPEIGKYLVKYRTHVQNVGWQAYVADGKMAGTSGRSLRLEGINIALDPSVGGGIEYRTHVQNIGWQGYVANDVMSGTSGMSYRLEAINIRLTGEAAQKYDIYYRVHTQNIGWMGWAKNDEASGSAGFGYRLEGIEVQLVLKGGAAPGNTVNAFVEAGI